MKRFRAKSPEDMKGLSSYLTENAPKKAWTVLDYDTVFAFGRVICIAEEEQAKVIAQALNKLNPIWSDGNI